MSGANDPGTADAGDRCTLSSASVRRNARTAARDGEAARPPEVPVPLCADRITGRRRAWGTVRPDYGREKFPTGWTDPLELYGLLRQQLTPPEFDPPTERVQVSELVRRHGAQWVWHNRQRLLSLRRFAARIGKPVGPQRPNRKRGAEAHHGSTL